MSSVAYYFHFLPPFIFLGSGGGFKPLRPEPKNERILFIFFLFLWTEGKPKTDIVAPEVW